MLLRRPLALVALVVAAIAGIVLAAHDAVASFAIRTVAGRLGYALETRSLHLGASELTLVDPVVTGKGGEPVFRADRVAVSFSLRDLLPGGHRLYGLRAVDVSRPQVTLIHNQDGTYNVALPSAGGPSRPSTTPLDVRVRVSDGTVAFVDRFIDPGHERRQSLVGLNVDAVLAPTDPSYYRVDATLEDGSGHYPIVGRARFDHRRRFASQHWHANVLPIGALADFMLQNHAANVVDGRLRDLDARSYGFMRADGTTDTHLGATAYLEHGKVFAQALALPIGDAHGPLYINGGGLETTGIDATLAAVPLHLVGSVYDLAHPTLRFLITGSGPLERLKTIARGAAKRPLSGDVTLALRADGALAKPLVRGSFHSSRFVYDRYVLRDVDGAIAFSGQAFSVVNVRGRYGPIALNGGGALDLGKQTRTDLVAAVNGPSDGLPYANALLPHVTLSGVIVLSGVGTKLGATGYLAGRGPGGTLDAPFDVDASGTGIVGPLALARPDGASLYARLDLDRPHGGVVGIVAAHRLSLLPARNAVLPGFPARLPTVHGALDADLALDIRGSALADAAGVLHLHGATIGALALGNVDARLNGNGANAMIPDLRVRGPLADLDARGAYASGVLAAEGRIRTSFTRLATVLHGIPASGTFDVPLRVVADREQKVLQIDGARFDRAQLRGIPLHDASATVSLRGENVDVAGARLGVANGRIVALGGLGRGRTLHLAAGGIDAGALRGAGLALGGGTLAAIAQVTGPLRTPDASLGFALSDSSLAGVPLDAAASARYANGTLRLDDALLTLADATAEARGTVSGIARGTSSARADLTAHASGVDVATLARLAHLRLPYPDAAVIADVRVQGPLRDPSIAGSARIPVGSINGLAFRDVVVPVHGNLSALAVTGGRATVGSTTLHFDATASRARTRLALDAPHLNLADFNGYFDSADTLDGRGHAAAALTLGGSSLATSGDVVLAGTRVRRLPIGEINAHWSTRGRTIAANAALGGPKGRLAVNGSATIPAGNPVRALRSSALDVNAKLSGLDLSSWLPALGVKAPLSGTVGGTAQIRGLAPYPGIAMNAALEGGLLGRLPIESFTIAGTSDRRRIHVTRAELRAFNVTATGSGSVGLGTRDPIELSLHAASPDIGALALRATGKPYDVGGALAANLRVTGTRLAPDVAGTLDLARPHFHGADANRAHVDLAFGNRRLVLNDASLDFATGRLALSGSVPATTTPPFVDRRNAPIEARVLAQHIDVGQFTPLFPYGTKLGGLINGDLRVAGTFSDPFLNGTMALTKGSYASNLLASELTNGTMQIALSGHSALLQRLHANMGGGAIDGDGQASVGDLRAFARTATFAIRTRENKLGIEIPRLFKSKIDGALAVSRTAGSPILIDGNLAFSHARIPITALLPRPPAKNAKQPLPVAFNLGVAATADDRVQGPNVDVGATGHALLGGTLAAPTLAGAFSSTDGTVSFYRRFVIDRARVAFSPANGIIPNVNATATTHIPDPPTDVLLQVRGPATQLSLTLASQPEYDRAQILGLLVNAQALGAVSGIAQTPSTQGGGPGPLQSFATGYVNSEFTRTLFQPFSSSLAQSLGFTSFEFAPSLSGGYTASFVRRLGNALNVSFSQTQSTQTGYRQSVAFSANLKNATQVQLTLFNSGTQAYSIGTSSPFVPSEPTNWQVQAMLPPPGSSGFVLSYVHRFWTARDRTPTPQQIERRQADSTPTVGKNP
jgi:autotransporter translocation and assembly factor TamB